MLVLRRAFWDISRRLFRTVLVCGVLSLCIAVLVSTIAGVQSSQEDTEKAIEVIELDTAAEVARVGESLADIEADVESTTEETIDIAAQMNLMITVRSDRGGPFGGDISNIITEEQLEQIAAIEGVAIIVPEIDQGIGESDDYDPEDRFNRFMNYAYRVIGVPLDADLIDEYPILPSGLLEGRLLEEGDEGVVILSDDLQEYFTDAGVGDIIELVDLEGATFNIVGISSSRSSESDSFPPGINQKLIYMSLDDAQNVLGVGGATIVTVYAETEEYVDAIAADIEEVTGLNAITQDEMMRRVSGDITWWQQEGLEQTQSAIEQEIEQVQVEAQAQIASLKDNLSNTETMGFQIIIVSGVVGILMIFGIMFFTVRERSQEIGVLKALGFSNPDILNQFMLEGLYLGFLGGLLGVVLGAVTYSFLGPWLLDTEASVSLELSYLAIGLGAASIAGALGSLYPAWLASRVSPMEALRQG